MKNSTQSIFIILITIFTILLSVGMFTSEKRILNLESSIKTITKQIEDYRINLNHLESKIVMIEYDNESLLHYKNVCIKKTSEQHEINNYHGSVVKEILEAVRPAFDLDEIESKEAE